MVNKTFKYSFLTLSNLLYLLIVYSRYCSDNNIYIATTADAGATWSSTAVKTVSSFLTKLDLFNVDGVPSVFVCEGGEPGRSAVWKAPESNITFQKALHRVRMKIAFLPDLLVYNLKADADKQKLDELFTGSTIKHFTGRSLAGYPVAIPPLDEQKEIVRQVDKLLTLADKMEEHYQKARVKVDALAQSILAKAFRGELVQQNPDDEPAEKLLQRIQEEKAKMEAELKIASKGARKARRNAAKLQEKQAGEP